MFLSHVSPVSPRCLSQVSFLGVFLSGVSLERLPGVSLLGSSNGGLCCCLAVNLLQNSGIDRHDSGHVPGPSGRTVSVGE